MAVLGPIGVTLIVPDLQAGKQFYTNAGLIAEESADRITFHCEGQVRPCIVLLQGERKRLHHIALAADPARFGEPRNHADGRRHRCPRRSGADGPDVALRHRSGALLREVHDQPLSTTSTDAQPVVPRSGAGPRAARRCVRGAR